MFSCVSAGFDHPFDASRAEAARNDDSVHAFIDFRGGIGSDFFAVNPFYVYIAAVFITRGIKRFHDGKIGIVKFDVLPDERYRYVFFSAVYAADKFFPRSEVEFASEFKFSANDLVESVVVKHYRRLIKAVERYVRDYAIGFNVAEKRDFLSQVVAYVGIGTGDDNVRVNTERLKFFNAVLSWLCFIFVRAGNVRNEADVNEQAVFSAYVRGVLSDCFEKVRALDVAYRSADFGDNHVGFGNFGVLSDEFFRFVGYVRNYLNGLTEIFASSFLFENFGKYLARSEVGVFVEVLVDKSFVMPEVEIGFRAVLCHVNFAVLNGVHRSRVNVHIGVEFLSRDFVTSEF